MNHSPCPDREPKLQALLFGELDPVDQVTLEAHIEYCAGCRHSLKDARAGLDALADLPDPPLPFEAPL